MRAKMWRIPGELPSFCSALFRRVRHDESGDVREFPIIACHGFHENVRSPTLACLASGANAAGRGSRIMPSCEIKKKRFLGFPKIAPCARHYPELGKITQFSQAGIVLSPFRCSASENNVVEDFNLEQLPGANQVAGHFDVGLARCWITAGMIVD